MSIHSRCEHRRTQQRALHVLTPLCAHHLADDLRNALQIVVTRYLLQRFAESIQWIRSSACCCCCWVLWLISCGGVRWILRTRCSAREEIRCGLAEIADDAGQRDGTVVRGGGGLRMIHIVSAGIVGGWSLDVIVWWWSIGRRKLWTLCSVARLIVTVIWRRALL